jgi:trehalose synthase
MRNASCIGPRFVSIESGRSLEATSDLWWKNAIVYCVDTQSYQDSNGDGVGDFRGLTQRIDYLAGLGVTCLWLMPFYPSPERDYGYDVADYYGIAEKYGTFGDFVELVRTARERGIRVIADLVVNHTSSDHPWFQLARRDRDSSWHDFYVWADVKPRDADQGVIFPGEQQSVWSYDRSARRWYLHRFHDHQPDLNIANAAVRDEIHKVIGFWLELGLSGFRVDAVPFLIEHEGILEPAVRDPHDYLRDQRKLLSRRRGDAMLLAEANEPLERLGGFFGDRGNQMHVLFNFVVNQALYLSLVRGAAAPVASALEALPPIPSDCQWATFVRNHDELSLDKLTDDEREEVFAALAPRESMRIYGRGIRRRLPSMVDGDRRRMELMYSLLFTLPGTPVLFYGEEIGMGDDERLDGREAVRLPMQWAPETGRPV